ncbi:MAG: porin family protein [Tannerella sp.]|jgi:opacity protein-like surface antigen|nr:porin family protein [Tannerella sp.]
MKKLCRNARYPGKAVYLCNRFIKMELNMKGLILIRKILLSTVLVLVSTVTVCAQRTWNSAPQQGDMAVGLQVATAFGSHYANAGAGGRFQYNVFDWLRGEGAFTCFLKKDHVILWNAGVNAHYLLPLNEMVTFYPLAGTGLVGRSHGRGAGDLLDPTSPMANLGAGADFQLNEYLFLNVETTFRKIFDGSERDGNRLLLSAGLSFRF